MSCHVLHGISGWQDHRSVRAEAAGKTAGPSQKSAAVLEAEGHQLSGVGPALEDSLHAALAAGYETAFIIAACVTFAAFLVALKYFDRKHGAEDPL